MWSKSRLTVSLLLLCGFAGSAQAFHDRGVASCGSCHILHDSQDGFSVAYGSTGEALLLEENSTDLCLSCHAESLGEVMGMSPTSPPAERGPGNFIFLTEDNLNDEVKGAARPIPGERAGHNLSSASYGLQPDLQNSVSPGGGYPSQNMGCVSCHDPHGNSNYRLLYGSLQETADGYAFLYDAPRAEGLPAGELMESPVGHIAYLEGWSEWCANCHGLYHDSGGGGFPHPVLGTLSSAEATVYNDYDGDDNPIGGDFGSSYLPEVPLQDLSMTPNSTQGATGSSEISCMSCHRAHASSAPYALRWDPAVLTLGEDGIASGSWPIPNPYLDPNQRSLCVKCHEPKTRNHHDNRPCMGCHDQNVGPPGADPDVDVFGQ